MPEVSLSAGPIDYQDTGGDGPVLVFIHGLIMDHTLWRHVVADVQADYRCVVPTLPFGAHRRPMRPDADVSMGGLAGLISELLERLDLREVTLVICDWGGPLLLASAPADPRVARLVITPCEAFENVPPGLPGRLAGIAAWAPGGIRLALWQLRVGAIRKLPTHLGWMAKRPIPDEIARGWTAPGLASCGVRRDVARYARGARGGRRELVAAMEGLRRFAGPVLVAWAAEDRVMPPEHGRRLAALFPDARHVEIADSYTLIPEDQPAALVAEMRAFLEPSGTGPSAGPGAQVDRVSG
ncbi:MAG TPA: alpha/beta fold hydrolase [Solirubrobacteraceae bacterium]|jgi:pimeloyl-ACP methyl ester carboxylesterase|nr:alpha/beta fold hydrolase [Solirubrobacteraceae bacterium]